MKNKFKNIALICGVSLMAFAASCSDLDDEIKSSSYDRLFSPTAVEARVQNKTNVRLGWTKVLGADSYVIELFANDSLQFEGSPVTTYNEVTDNPYTITGLDGETKYSARIKAVGEKISESKWTGVFFKTDAEQNLQSVPEEDLTAFSVTLRWPAGATATEIILNPGNIRHTVTAAEITAGAATIEDLLSETTYTAKLMNGEKTRGSVNFTTLIDLGGATAIKEGDDLQAILNEAEEGAAFVIMSGEFTLGEYALTKSVSLTGYSSNAKPTIHGRFTVGDATVANLVLNNLILSGATEKMQNNLIETTNAAANLQNVELTGCEIRDFANALVYNNAGSTWGTLKIDNCIIDRILGSGGDGIDFRGGSLSSITVTNTTFSNGFRAFLRCQTTAAVSFTNCTFYRVAIVDNSNNSGLFRTTQNGCSLVVKKCLFYGTGVESNQTGNIGVWARTDIKGSEEYADNYYYNCFNLWGAKYADNHSNVATEANPGFKDPENGDYTLSNEDLIFHQIGDPRWY